MRPLQCLALGSMLLALGACTCGRGSETPPPEQARPPETLVVTSFRLANGLEVELVSGACGDEAGVVVLYAVGADHDPAGRSGMSRLVAQILSARGATARIESGNEHTLASFVAARDRLPAELDAAAARMKALELTQAELAGARTEVLMELARMRGGDAAQTARSYAAESMRPTRGDGWQGGVAPELEAMDVAQVEAFWRAHYAPSNARLVVAGRFDPAAIRARIEEAFGPLPAGAAPVPREPADATVTGTLVFGDAPSAVAVAVRAPAPAEAFYPAFLVLATRLTATPTPARAWEASYDAVHRPEMLFISGPIQPGRTPEAAAAELRTELGALVARPLAPADVDAAKERFGPLLGLHERDPLACAADPRAFAVARARRAQLGLATLPLGERLDTITTAQLEEAAGLFGPRRTAAVVAGGTIR